MELKENTILITGATSGIGLAFAEAFLKEGNTVLVCGRREERLAALKEKHPSLQTKVCDVSKAEDREALARWAIDNFPAVNMLINNAGVQLKTDMTKPVDLSRIYAEIDTNIVAPLHLASLLLPHLQTKRRSAIVNISSGLAFSPLAFMPVYCATKAAIHSLSLSLRYQLRNTSVSVFEIAPPAVDTELGMDRREDKAQTHGGMPVAAFLAAALHALRHDIYEEAVGSAKETREKREALFEVRNNLVKG
ncbi:MAG: SDR family NAD(P)-dependent oxidoreductase [Bacteroidota bacterium]|nr:SDR family NAD(P)-dependent oxidoreductase [Bacteroidota bacterium]